MNNLKYKPTIGLEIHSQLNTKSKIFSNEHIKNSSIPNIDTNIITLAHPGTLPSINQKTIFYIIKIGIICNSKITKKNIFDRKNYFYPDLPKGYQITQYRTPICQGGYIIINKNNKKKKIKINRIHLEEDSGKLIYKDKTFINFNRAGTPLIEIVTEPEIETSNDAYIFLQEIKKILKYLNICDGNMEKGSIRIDANISIKKNKKRLKNKIEVKNINSIKNVKNSIDYEIKRQIKIIEKGGKIQSETRNYNIKKRKTIKQREKTTINDYRYFPEPDLSPIIISKKVIRNIKKSINKLPSLLLKKFKFKYKLSDHNYYMLIKEKKISFFFNKVCKLTSDYKMAFNWIIGPIKSYLKKNKIEISKYPISPEKISNLIELIKNKKINLLEVKSVYSYLIDNPETNLVKIVEKIKENKNDLNVKKIALDIIKDNPEKVKEYRNGKKGILNMLIGKIIKKTKKKIEPKIIIEILKNHLLLKN